MAGNLHPHSSSKHYRIKGFYVNISSSLIKYTVDAQTCKLICSRRLFNVQIFWDPNWITVLLDFLSSYCLWPESCPVWSVFYYTSGFFEVLNFVPRLGTKFIELFVTSVNCSRSEDPLYSFSISVSKTWSLLLLLTVVVRVQALQDLLPAFIFPFCDQTAKPHTFIPVFLHLPIQKLANISLHHLSHWQSLG